MLFFPATEASGPFDLKWNKMPFIIKSQKVFEPGKLGVRGLVWKNMCFKSFLYSVKYKSQQYLKGFFQHYCAEKKTSCIHTGPQQWPGSSRWSQQRTYTAGSPWHHPPSTQRNLSFSGGPHQQMQASGSRRFWWCWRWCWRQRGCRWSSTWACVGFCYIGWPPRPAGSLSGSQHQLWRRLRGGPSPRGSLSGLVW